MKVYKCQIQSTNAMNNGHPQYVHMSLRRRMRITFARYMDPDLKRSLKNILKRITKLIIGRNQSDQTSPKGELKNLVGIFKTGDLVRIRSLDEIKTTLDSHSQLKGCKFMPEMALYCGTFQRVYKPLERFLNEFDYTIRKSNGLVLLENVYCQGVAEAGRCDRSCFFFWRVEWLEKVDNSQ